ncbi:MAG: antibiotic biosynthesis monooxygenase [Flavobacteriaceae bacterium]|nr:antibiotic biosynthesis monooxygenase [Flavobacteriaceae bacterium]
MIANTPPPPYYAVIFSTLRTEIDKGYLETARHMEELAKQQEGYLGIESVRTDLGVTISYWKSLDAITKWKHNAQHKLAREKGRKLWYKAYKLRICKVERDYDFNK